MKSLVLYFFLLVLRVFFDFTSNVIYERGRFSKTLLEEGLEFVPSEESDPVPLNLSFVLLPAKIDPISEEQSQERDALGARDTVRVEMIFTLSAKVITLHV